MHNHLKTSVPTLGTFREYGSHVLNRLFMPLFEFKRRDLCCFRSSER